MSIEETPILIIDDEEIVLLAISESLKPEGYKIVTTTSPYEGIELLKEQDFAVIISDHHMPGMTGLEFFGEVDKIQPLASRILITGVLTLKVVVDAINKGEIFRFIAKPWIREELLATVKNAFNRYDLMSQNYRLQQQTQSSNTELISKNEDLERLNKDLKAKLRISETALTRSRSNLDSALELALHVVHNLDPEMGYEARLVVKLCEAMIQHPNFPEELADTLHIASYLTAMGKINIERAQLQEFQTHPNELNSEQREYFHNIPVYSQLHASRFENHPGLSQTVRASYERMDGTGYPDGLNRSNIPPAAKFLSLAVFYAESHLSTEQTLSNIRNLSGSSFDSEAVSIFLEANSGDNLSPKTQSVPTANLKPGMVIGEDLRYPSGAMLLPKGSSLGESTISMLLNSRRINLPQNSIQIYR